MRTIDKICKETIIQALENSIYRTNKYKNRKIKIMKNEDYNILVLNLSIAREEIDKINNIGKYIITNEEQYKRYIKEKENGKRKNDNRLLRRWEITTKNKNKNNK